MATIIDYGCRSPEPPAVSQEAVVPLSATATNADLLRWAARQGATTTRELATLLSATARDAGGWRKNPEEPVRGSLRWVVAAREARLPVSQVGVPIDRLDAWMLVHGFQSFASLAAMLGVSRQKAQYWRTIGVAPAWVADALQGYEASHGKQDA